MNWKFFIFLMSFFLFILLIPRISSAQTISSVRIDGKDRFEVAINTSKSGWPSGSDTILLANYHAFADALTASPLAYKENAPILLTESTKLSSVVKMRLPD